MKPHPFTVPYIVKIYLIALKLRKAIKWLGYEGGTTTGMKLRLPLTQMY